ncbi:MAG: hypothetical protein M1162_05315 [Candidatus Thermoplasmatota archaeon]|nr:hypothetical protein [Candidatus Thermoplasmatota archaeon]
MGKLRTMIYGIYPRSDSLRVAISRWERGKETTENLRNAISVERSEILERFRKSAEIYTDPCVNWHDIFRPIAGVLDGISPGRLERYTETNTFFRKPVIEKLPEYDGKRLKQDLPENLPAPYFRIEPGSSLLLPAPYSLYRASEDTSGVGEGRFAGAVMDAYAEIAEETGARKIILREVFPYVSGLPDYAAYLNGRFEVSLVTKGRVGKTGASHSGNRFESVIMQDQDIGFAEEAGKVPGIPVIDASNTLLESSADARIRAEGIMNERGLKELIITTSDHLDFLPRVIADRKLAILGEAGAVL